MNDKSPTPNYYQRRIGGVLLDPYRIARLYGIADDPLFSAMKKLLAAGQRGAKDKAQDVQDAIDALLRWQEMERENVFGNEVVELEPDRERILPPDYATNVETMLRVVFSMDGGESEGKRPKKTLFVTTPGGEAELRWSPPDDREMTATEVEELRQMVLRLAPEHAANKPITDDDAEDAAPEDVCRGLLFDVGSRLGFREGTHVVAEAERVAARIAELERENAILKNTHKEDRGEIKRQEEMREKTRRRGEEARSDAKVEREARLKAERELQRVRDEVSAQKFRGEAAELDLARVRNESSAQRSRAENAERERDEWHQVADDLDKTVHELTDRYRPRRQSEEPAPAGVRVMVWSNDSKPRWQWRDGQYVLPNEIWTHQPPAPEAEREGE